MNKIYNEDCFITMGRDEMISVADVVLTSPPYNTSRHSASDKYNSRYDVFVDSKTSQEYIDWTIKLFESYDRILAKNGVVLYNISYSSEDSSTMWLLVADIIRNTNFTTADCVIWKKTHAIPNNRSANKLTRIVEYVFVFCRKTELKTFEANKNVVSVVEKTGQKNYENVHNFIEAKNNDGSNDLNKATFSTDFAVKMLNMYCRKGETVYDSFMGVGTTAKACMKLGVNYIGSELSEGQICLFEEHLRVSDMQMTLF